MTSKHVPEQFRMRTSRFINPAKNKKPEDRDQPNLPALKGELRLGLRLMVARFRATDDEFAAEEFLVMQLRDGAFCFVDGLHLNKGEAFGTLIVPVADHFRVLHVTNAIEELKQIAFAGVEREVTDVKPGSSDLDGFRFASRTFAFALLLWLVRLVVRMGAVTRRRRLRRSRSTPREKSSHSLPKRLRRLFRIAPVLITRIPPAIAPLSRTATRMT